MNDIITDIEAMEILDSRGYPTVQVTMTLEDGTKATASVPSGASTGENEALEMRDGDMRRYGGKGVLNAVANVEDKIAPEIIGLAAHRQTEIDHIMLELDATENKRNLGANAILGVSMAAAVEFSFLLGAVTLSAASLYDLLKHGREMIQVFDFFPMALGLVFAFVSAMLSVKWMVGYLNRYGLELFGYYRIAIAVLAWWVFLQ